MAQRSVKVPTRLTRTDRSTEFSAVATATRTHTRRVSRAPHARGNTDAADRAPVVAAPAAKAPSRVHADSDPITVTLESVVTGATAERLVAMQLKNFAPLAEVAVQRQTRSHDEMMAICADPDFVKVVGWKGGNPVGFGVLTNVLAKVPEVSSEFFAARYPEHFARNAVYFGIYITVDEPLRGLTVFWRVSTEMWQVPARESGILVFDVCEFNRSLFGAEDVANGIASPFPGSSVSVVDRQSWFVAELPAPIPGS